MFDDRKTNGSSEYDLDHDFFRSLFQKPSPVKLLPPETPKIFSFHSNPLIPSNPSHFSSKPFLKEIKDPKGRQWTSKEDSLLKAAAALHSGKNWKAISKMIPGRTHAQCSQRWRRIQPYKIRQPWTNEEDKKLMDLVKNYGQNWCLIASIIEGRTGKQIRERWLNKLNPDIDRSRFSQAEDQKIIELFRRSGAKWKEISKEMPGRTENMVKNRFYSFIKRDLMMNQSEVYKELFEATFKKESPLLKHSKPDLEEINKKIESPFKLESKKCDEILQMADNKHEIEQDFKKEKQTVEPIDRMNFLSKKKEILEGLLMNVMGQIQECHFLKNPNEL